MRCVIQEKQTLAGHQADYFSLLKKIQEEVRLTPKILADLGKEILYIYISYFVVKIDKLHRVWCTILIGDRIMLSTGQNCNQG